MIDQCVIIGSFDANHFQELVSTQCHTFCFRQTLGVFIVFTGTLDHICGHGCVVRTILMEVHNPFQTCDEVLCGTISFFVALLIYPLNTLSQVESPGQTAIFCSPLFSDSGNQLALVVCFQQTFVCVTQNVQVVCHFCIQNEYIFHFTVSGFESIQIGKTCSLVFVTGTAFVFAACTAAASC